MNLNVIFIFTVMFIFWTPVLHARHYDGFGFFLDFGQLKAVNNDTGIEYQTSIMGGVQYDYQLTIGDSFSFSLLGKEFIGKGVLSDNIKYEYYKAGIIGSELRAWMRPLSIGVDSGQYYLTWIESVSSYSGIKWSSGSEFGLSLSWHNEKSKKIAFDDLQEQRVEGKRIIIGYRWC